MKYLLSIVSLATCLVVTLSTKACYKDGDCKENECCIAGGIGLILNKGHCFKLTQKGRTCNRKEAGLKYYDNKYFLHCPCADGLDCVVSKGTLGKCRVSTSKPTAQPVKETEGPEVPVEPETPEPEIPKEPETPEETEETKESEESGLPEEPEFEIGAGPGGEDPRPDDPDCADWTYGC